jgi:hypothetical protein
MAESPLLLVHNFVPLSYFMIQVKHLKDTRHDQYIDIYIYRK